MTSTDTTSLSKFKTFLIIDFVGKVDKATFQKRYKPLIDLGDEVRANVMAFIYFSPSIPEEDRSVLLDQIRRYVARDNKSTDTFVVKGLNDYFDIFPDQPDTVGRRFNQDWARDLGVSIDHLNEDGVISFVVPFRQRPPGPGGVPPVSLAPFLFAQSKERRVRPLDLNFSGGNIICGGGVAFVGQDIIAENIPRLSNQMNRKILQQEIDNIGLTLREGLRVKRIYWIGTLCDLDGKLLEKDSNQFLPSEQIIDRPASHNSTTFGVFQPCFHIDNFITWGGLNDDGQWLLFVGQQIMLSGDQSLPENQLANNAAKALDNIAMALDGIKVLGKTVKVVRIPLPFHNAFLIQEMTHFSMNSVLVENYLDNGIRMRRIVMPLYSRDFNIPTTLMDDQEWEQLEELQDQAKAIYMAEKFSILPIDFEWVLRAFFSRSALHCYVNVVERH